MSSSKNKSVVISLLAICIGMFGLAYASVPLYELFCKVTGFGGTTQVTQKPSDVILDRIITVRFNADTSSDVPWAFKPEQKEVNIHVGETRLIFYSAENNSDKPVRGTAVYNVTPNKAGAYFNKIECFCFTEQVLAPGEKATFPVSFFIDPQIEDDKNLDDVKTITLSYTFFRVKGST